MFANVVARLRRGVLHRGIQGGTHAAKGVSSRQSTRKEPVVCLKVSTVSQTQVFTCVAGVDMPSMLGILNNKSRDMRITLLAQTKNMLSRA